MYSNAEAVRKFEKKINAVKYTCQRSYMTEPRRYGISSVKKPYV